MFSLLSMFFLSFLNFARVQLFCAKVPQPTQSLLIKNLEPLVSPWSPWASPWLHECANEFTSLSKQEDPHPERVGVHLLRLQAPFLPPDTAQQELRAAVRKAEEVQLEPTEYPESWAASGSIVAHPKPPSSPRPSA